MTLPCDKCDGDGHYIVFSGSYYDSAQEQYYPSEKVVACDECDGRGWLNASEDVDE